MTKGLYVIIPQKMKKGKKRVDKFMIFDFILISDSQKDLQNWYNNDKMIETIFIFQLTSLRKGIDLIPGNRLYYEEIKVVSLLWGFFCAKKQIIKGGNNGRSKKTVKIFPSEV